MQRPEVAAPVADDSYTGRCVNCARDGAIRWKGWCACCGGHSMLCRDCAANPSRTVLGRSCARCYGRHPKHIGKGKTN